MVASRQKAIYVDENAKFSVRDDLPVPSPAENELLVKVHFSGANPADVRHSTILGICSTVVGYDFAGEVLQAPADSEFKKGDIVAGFTPTRLGRPLKYGAHQDYLAAPCDMSFRVPPHLPESHASALAVALMSAADAVFNLFKAPLPTEPVANDKPLLIWGGATSVGISAIQFARASGFKHIFATASPARHETLKGLGATHLFDYRSPTVITDITNAAESLGHGPIAYALDAVGTRGENDSSELVLKTVDASASIASVLIRQNPRFKAPFATTNTDFTLQPPGVPHPIVIPARPDNHWHAWKAFGWAVENYGNGFQLPSVTVLDETAEEVLEVLRRVEDGKQGHGKFVFKHPLK